MTLPIKVLYHIRRENHMMVDSAAKMFQASRNGFIMGTESEEWHEPRWQTCRQLLENSRPSLFALTTPSRAALGKANK